MNFKKFSTFSLLALLVSITCSNIIFGQQEQYQFDAIDGRNGLSSNQANAIFKDEKEFIWVGTMSGLNRYDGYSFKTFKHKSGDSTSINEDSITRVVEGPKHTLWVQTRNGWNIFDRQTETFTSGIQPFLYAIGITREINNRASGSAISWIVKDRENNFWFVLTGIGLYKFNSSTNKTTFFNNKSKAPLYSNTITHLAADKAGFMWIAYPDGVLEKLDDKANKLVSRSNALQQYSNNQNYSYRLFVDNENDLGIYCNGAERGVYYYNTSSNRLMPINKESKDVHLNNNIVRGIIQDDKGNI